MKTRIGLNSIRLTGRRTRPRSPRFNDSDPLPFPVILVCQTSPVLFTRRGMMRCVVLRSRVPFLKGSLTFIPPMTVVPSLGSVFGRVGLTCGQEVC